MLALGGGALGLLPFISVAPNRLVSGQPVMLAALAGEDGWLAAPLLVPLVGLLCCALVAPRRPVLVATLLGWLLLFSGALWGLGEAATRQGAISGLVARIAPGSGLWLLLACSLLGATDTVNRLTGRPLWRILLNLPIWLLPLAMLASGHFAATSLLREYDNRADVFHDALVQHLLFLPGTLLPALVIALPLGWLCHRSPRARRGVLPILNIIQTVPSVALFGLLIAPLTSLVGYFPWLGRWGVSGIGTAPALIALVLYALMPLVRGVVSGLGSVPGAVKESARGMGMSTVQLAWQVEIPLALPVLLRSLRVVAVQTVGLAVVAALIGAGGLGALVFQGLLSSALDLVLLGVIPTVALAVVVDAGFTLLLALLEERI
nr:ABC transporter permease [Shimwellia pseudoproteus]